MNAAALIDPIAVRKFISLVHERAAAAIYGLKDQRPCVLHLDAMAPDDRRFWHAPYNIGDVERMVKDALIEAEAHKNVFIEPRLVRPGRPCERGDLYATQAVIALVGDGDVDTDKPFTPRTPASAVVETSFNNEHSWYFLKHAIGVTDAVELGKRMRESCGGDHCSGNPVQPFRLAGTPNFPNQKKRDRGRIAVPTRILRITDRTYTATELAAWFSADAPLPPVCQPAAGANAEKHRPAYCRSRAKAILAADPGDDRSAQFMSAARYAALGGITAEELETVARQYPNGCAGKYGNRLLQEINRCYGKMGLSENSDDPPSGNSDDNQMPRYLADPELNASALRIAGLVAHSKTDSGHVTITVKAAAAQLNMPKSTVWDGLNRLIGRKWLIAVATDTYTIGRGPSEISDNPLG